MNNFKGVRTEVLTLSYIDKHNYQFVIPSYQRPYVWPDDDVLKLFDDINAAQEAGESHYFIGTVLSAEDRNEHNHPVYELIDGQQRTTTLILIALAFKHAEVNVPLSQLATIHDKPRLAFSIREQVQQLLGATAGLENYIYPSDETIEKNPYLTRIAGALKVLSQRVKNLGIAHQYRLSEYIYSNVQWVNNIVPHDMDLNRMFATMNTAGVQLEQTDILKSKLFKKIREDKPIYDAIWMACEYMENYFERNVRQQFSKANWSLLEPKDLAAFSRQVFHSDSSLPKDDNAKNYGLSIADLAKSTNIENTLPCGEIRSARQKDEENDDNEKVYCRSIINFPLLLIHAYRIYLINRGMIDIEPRLHSDHLLKIFEPLTKAEEKEVKFFIEVLWKVRYQFDYWIVKWVERDDGGDEKLLLTRQSRSESYINRSPKEVNDLVQLQSVRNFTGERSAQYWLTPFIARLIEENISEEKQVLTLLEQIDNQLSLAGENETQKSASFKLALKEQPNTAQMSIYLNYLRDANKGTGFEHYWFQKLEYLLWKKRGDSSDEKFKRYRIASRNSVEHVHPQHEEYQRNLPDSILNSFGNLVLLSPGGNSSYSNQAVKKKKADFESKPHYDSLKLKAIFDLMKNDNWDEKLIEQHREEMLSTLSEHYSDY
ncbi:MAG: DUF262 domain-containing protein [Candidatus Thiothrix moscowensis]|nr:DUF262 domain-containing protein [Candidatus Thiothrix moscowensis]